MHSTYVASNEGQCKLLHGCMVYTERAPRQQQFHVSISHVTTKQRLSTSHRWLFKTLTMQWSLHSYTDRLSMRCETSSTKASADHLSTVSYLTAFQPLMCPQSMYLTCADIIMIIIITAHLQRYTPRRCNTCSLSLLADQTDTVE